MATTTFLELIVPAHNEFPDSWDQPMNANFETLDDFIAALRAKLDGGSATDTTYSALVGTMATLAARLAVSINPDGTVNVGTSPDLVAMTKSKSNGTYATPAARMDAEALEMHQVRARVLGTRTDGAATSLGDLDVALAARFGRKQGDTIFDSLSAGVQSPMRSFAPNVVVDGPLNHVTTTGAGTVVVDGDPTPIVANVDGHLFRVRHNIELDIGGAPTPPANGDTVYIYLERGNYNGANHKYLRPGFGGPSAASDLRVLQSGTDGSNTGTSFTAASGLFGPGSRQAAAGDILRITGGGNAGDYVVESVSSNTTLVLKTAPPSNLAGMTWELRDEMAPNIGFVAVAAGTLPTGVAGRVYIAEATFATGPLLSNLVVYAKNGVFVHSALGVVAPGANIDILTINHNLGALPTSVEVFCSPAGSYTDTTAEYPPMVLRNLGDGAVPIRLPSMMWRVTRKQIILRFVDPDATKAFYHDVGGTPVTTANLRVVARR